jgi:hypothetical protein
MKKIFFSLAVAAAAIVFASCGNNNAGTGTSKNDSSSENMTKPASNSDATNPSVADTAYSNDSTKMKKDSSKIK